MHTKSNRFFGRNHAVFSPQSSAEMSSQGGSVIQAGRRVSALVGELGCWNGDRPQVDTNGKKKKRHKERHFGTVAESKADRNWLVRWDRRGAASDEECSTFKLKHEGPGSDLRPTNQEAAQQRSATQQQQATKTTASGWKNPKKRKCRKQKKERINFLRLLIHLWPGNWEDQLERMNERVQAFNREQIQKKRNAGQRHKKAHGIAKNEFWVFFVSMISARIHGRQGQLWDDEDAVGPCCSKMVA
jgi:hypothetical protein